MELIIETKNESRQGDIINAYNIAMEKNNIPDFMKSLESNIGATEVGCGGNHVWIYDTLINERIAIVVNLLK